MVRQIMIDAGDALIAFMSEVEELNETVLAREMLAVASEAAAALFQVSRLLHPLEITGPEGFVAFRRRKQDPRAMALKLRFEKEGATEGEVIASMSQIGGALLEQVRKEYAKLQLAVDHKNAVEPSPTQGQLLQRRRPIDHKKQPELRFDPSVPSSTQPERKLGQKRDRAIEILLTEVETLWGGFPIDPPGGFVRPDRYIFAPASQRSLNRIVAAFQKEQLEFYDRILTYNFLYVLRIPGSERSKAFAEFLERFLHTARDRIAAASASPAPRRRSIATD